LRAPAFVAQWIEHLTSDQRVGGSSPSERATSTKALHLCGQHLPTKSVHSSVASPRNGATLLR